MKKDRIICWTATGIVAAIMLWSALNFSLSKEMKGAFAHLGLPNWFRVELTVAKILGALALLIPAIPNRIKEFAYGGFAITLISAIIAHSSSGDGLASFGPKPAPKSDRLLRCRFAEPWVSKGSKGSTILASKFQIQDSAS
jgi:DoxX-like family